MARSHRLVAIARWQLRRLFRADRRRSMPVRLHLVDHVGASQVRCIAPDGDRWQMQRFPGADDRGVAHRQHSGKLSIGAVRCGGAHRSGNCGALTRATVDRCQCAMQIGSFHGQTGSVRMAIEKLSSGDADLLEMIGSDQEVRQTRATSSLHWSAWDESRRRAGATRISPRGGSTAIPTRANCPRSTRRSSSAPQSWNGRTTVTRTADRALRALGAIAADPAIFRRRRIPSASW